MKGKKTKKMMKTMKKADAVRALLAVLALLLLSGCTLMMDEEEPSTPDTPATGDGITAPRRVVSELGELTYQVAPGTRVLTNALRPYVVSVETDSTGSTTAFVLSDGVPADLLPQRGDYVVTEDLLDLFEAGLCHRVGLVSPAGGGGCRVSLSRAPVADVYKKLDLVTDFDVVRRPAPQKAYGLWAAEDAEPQYVYELRGIRQGPLAPYAAPALAADGDEEESSLNILDAYFGMKNGKYESMWKRFVKKDAYWDFSPYDGKQKYNFSYTGDLDVYARFTAGLFGHFEVSLERSYADVYFGPFYEVSAGAGGQRAEATFSLPIIGNASWKTREWLTTSPEAAEAEKRFAASPQLRTEDYWVPLMFPVIPFNIGPIPCKVGPVGGLVVDFYGFLEAAKPQGFEAGVKGQLFKLGLRSENGELGFYPFAGEETKKFEPYMTTHPIDIKLGKLGAGVRVNVYLGAQVTIGAVLNGTISGTFSPSSEVVLDVRRPRALSDVSFQPPRDSSGKEMGYAGASKWHNEVTAGVSIAADLDFGLWGVPLASWNPFEWKPFEHDKMWNPQLYVESVYPVPERSTPDSVCYVATVRCRGGNYFGTPLGQPELYVCDTYGGKSRRVLCRGGYSGAFDPGRAYEYEFRLHNIIDAGSHFAVPVLDGKYYAPEKFDLHGTTLSIKSAEAMRVKGKGGCLGDREQARAVRMTLGGAFMAKASRLVLEAEVVDEAGGKTRRAFELDPPRFGATYSKKLLFIIAYTGVRPRGVKLTLCYYDQDYRRQFLNSDAVLFDGLDELDGSPDYDFDALDLDDMQSWRKQGYELLQ